MTRIAPLLFRTTAHLAQWANPDHSEGLIKVFAAGVVNRSFCSKLLRDPSIALNEGYLEEEFNLTTTERAILLSIRAESLSDLARQMNRSLREKA